MASTFGILETAKSGLSVARQNLNITGHNLSNTDTVGYTRQRLNTSAIDPATSTYLIAQDGTDSAGRGVEVLGIEQIRSSYLDTQFRNLNSDYSYTESRAQALTYLEGLYNELDDDSGLTTAIKNFFSALNTFSNDTSSQEYRTNVQQQALSLTESFNIVYGEMTDLWNDQNDSISTTADSINSMATKMAELNSAIAQYERTGDTANDLRDERNLLLDELSGLVNVTYCNNEDNSSMVDVQIGGVDLVIGNTAEQIQVDSPSDHLTEINALTSQIADANANIALAVANGDPTADYIDEISGYLDELDQYVSTSFSQDADGITDVTFSGVSLVSGSTPTAIEEASSVDINAWIELYRNNLSLNGEALSTSAGNVTGGELCAHMEMITETGSDNSGIPSYMVQLNSLAREIAQNINEIHSDGYTYPDGSQTSQTGINFFDVPVVSDGAGGFDEDYSQITAGNFTLSDDVMSSVFNIAGSSEAVDTSADATETGNNATALLMFNDLNNSDYYGSLNSIVGQLAIAVDTNESILDTQQSLLNSVDSQRTSISGVSVDEETANLIVYQQSYNACARMVTTIDEMMDTLVNNTGIVGR
ncbi:MAG: flagellar hook-associated protein FlgK [Oscillospiraceae bacterium]